MKSKKKETALTSAAAIVREKKVKQKRERIIYIFLRNPLSFISVYLYANSVVDMHEVKVAQLCLTLP